MFESSGQNVPEAPASPGAARELWGFIVVRLSFRAGLVGAGLAAALTLSACAAGPTVEPSASPAAASSADTAAVATVTVSCEEFNSVATLDEAYAAMGSVTGSTYADANDHSLLAGAQTACSMDMSRTLNDVMIELTDGQVVVAPSDDTTDDPDSSSSSTDPVAEACSFSSNEPYYTVEILADFPDVWKSDAPLPRTGGNAICHQIAPDTAQLDRYWVYFEDEQAGEAPALAWDAALTSAGYSKSCRGGDVSTALQARTAGCEYIGPTGQPAAIDFDKGFGWQLWFLPHN